MSRELYIECFEEIYHKLIDGGCPEAMAEEIANEKAYSRMVDKLADMGDAERLRRKEQP